VSERLDAALAARGLARSRTHAARLIAVGLVSVDGAPALKPSIRVADTQEIAVAGADHYVSRAAHKLLAALDGFGIDPAGRDAIDLGASTGGFTQVLLERGAVSVVAVDVGHGQLAPEIAGDARVSAVEGYNVRYATRDSLAAAARRDIRTDLVVGDLSFISLRTVLPAVATLAEPDADFVLLIKPQFEVGREGIREGIVKAAPLRAEAIEGVLWAAWDVGLGTAGLLASPLPGTEGNREYLARFSRTSGGNPTDWLERVGAIVHD
jgi:23S rRNA (cytidine1920-2'-O)/16S rRNA (cytidine1409-2'-O)-methyltransferase